MEENFVCMPPRSCFDCPKPDCNYVGSVTDDETAYSRCGRQYESADEGGIRWVRLEVSGYDLSLQGLQ